MTAVLEKEISIVNETASRLVVLPEFNNIDLDEHQSLAFMSSLVESIPDTFPRSLNLRSLISLSSSLIKDLHFRRLPFNTAQQFLVCLFNNGFISSETMSADQPSAGFFQSQQSTLSRTMPGLKYSYSQTIAPKKDGSAFIGSIQALRNVPISVYQDPTCLSLFFKINSLNQKNNSLISVSDFDHNAGSLSLQLLNLGILGYRTDLTQQYPPTKFGVAEAII
jgi:hypothetical protein